MANYAEGVSSELLKQLKANLAYALSMTMLDERERCAIIVEKAPDGILLTELAAMIRRPDK